jgi:hypothetical protein
MAGVPFTPSEITPGALLWVMAVSLHAAAGRFNPWTAMPGRRARFGVTVSWTRLGVMWGLRMLKRTFRLRCRKARVKLFHPLWFRVFRVFRGSHLPKPSFRLARIASSF